MSRKIRGPGAAGFTLIELMIVIAIIALLAAVAVPSFITYRNKAYCSRAENDAVNILAGIACMFAEPEQSDVPYFDQIQQNEICSVDMNAGDEDGEINRGAIYFLTGSSWTLASAGVTMIAEDAPMAVTVNDSSGLCPRARDGGGAELFYTAYFGTGLSDGWKRSVGD